MRRTEYRCPYCSQTSSRRWNMKIHIQRRHDGGIGEAFGSQLSHSSSPQAFPNIRNSLYDSNYDYVHDNNRYIHQKHPSNSNYYQSSSSSFQEQENDSLSKMRDTIREMREVVEFENMSKQFQSPSLGQLSGFMPSFTIPLLSGINTTPNLVNYCTALLVLDDIFRNNRNIGFRGHICYNCFGFWVDPLYSNSEEMKSLIKSTKPSPHICNPKKVADAQKVEDIESKKDELQNALISLLVSLIMICCCFGQSKVYLKTEEITSPPSSSPAFDLLQRQNNNDLPQIDDDGSVKQQQSPLSCCIEGEEINCNSVDIDLTKVEKNHWAYRAIKEALDDGKSSIVIDSGQLIDFVRTTKASFGVYTGDIGESIRHFFMHLSFKDNKNNI